MGGGKTRVVVGISGASGSIYGIRLLEELRKNPSLEAHLVISSAGKRTLVAETVPDPADVDDELRRLLASLAEPSPR